MPAIELADAAPDARADAALKARPELELQMERIEGERERAWRAMDAAWKRVTDARDERARAKSLLDELEDYGRRGKLIKERRTGRYDPKTGIEEVERAHDDEALKAAEAAVGSADDRVRRANETHQAAVAAWEAASRLHEACRRYISGAARFRAAAGKTVTRRGESHADTVERLRREIADASAQIDAARRAPLPAAELARRIRAEVKRIGDRAAPIVGRDGVRWPPMLVGVNSVPDVLCLLARMFPDQLAEQAEATIGRAEGAMTDSQREAKLAELAERLIRLERDEEATIRAAERDGAAMARRGDADPRAVLGVDGPPPSGG